MKHIVNGISTNGVSVAANGRYYAVGFRTDCYGDNAWLVRFTSSYDNALAFLENEKAKHRLHDPRVHVKDEYRLWCCNLSDGKVAPFEPPPPEIDY